MEASSRLGLGAQQVVAAQPEPASVVHHTVRGSRDLESGETLAQGVQVMIRTATREDDVFDADFLEVEVQQEFIDDTQGDRAGDTGTRWMREPIALRSARLLWNDDTGKPSTRRSILCVTLPVDFR